MFVVAGFGFFLVLSWTLLVFASQPPGSDIVTEVKYDLLGTAPYGSQLFQVAASTNYEDQPYVLNLKLDLNSPANKNSSESISWRQGYDAGILTGKQMVINLNNVYQYLLEDYYGPVLVDIVNKFLDAQWDKYLSVDVPENFIDELKGLTAASSSREFLNSLSADEKPDMSAADFGRVASRGIVVANFPGTLSNLKFIFEDEYKNPPINSVKMFEQIKKDYEGNLEDLKMLSTHFSAKFKSFQCSNFGVWGSRTESGDVYSGRNLDWLTDMGVQKYKLVTVHHPEDGYPHAVVSYSGVYGAITGLSSEGISVHEANLESDDITFRGFPWMLRLRYVMSKASNLEEALTLWNSTSNTVGFNHGFGSAKDRKSVLLETMASHTAAFEDNDPREQELIYNGENIAIPRTDAVYRTNHGYDPYTVQHFMWNNTGAYDNSIMRYSMFPSILDDYSASGQLIGFAQAVNITSLVGDKGKDHMLDCDGDHADAGNVISVAFDPTRLTLYAAWENGHFSDESWTPAACNSYIKIELKDFL